MGGFGGKWLKHHLTENWVKKDMSELNKRGGRGGDHLGEMFGRKTRGGGKKRLKKQLRERPGKQTSTHNQGGAPFVQIEKGVR